jgi:hypothetical protein
MAELDFTFDPNTIEDRVEFTIYPVGEYIAEVTASDYKPTKSGNGKFIELEFTILDGEYAGRKYWDRLNVQHENKMAMDIANSSMKDLMKAIGKPNEPCRNTSMLHGIPVKLKVGISKRKDTGEDQNTVRYKPINAPAVSASRPQASAAGGNAPKKKPWEK